MMKNRAVFLDRDGVVNEMVYNPEFGLVDSPLNPEEFRLRPDVALVIKTLREMDFKVIIISNQPGIAKGKMNSKILEAINNKMKQELFKKGAYLDDIYYCLHHPDVLQVKVKRYLKECDCRKPRPGLLLKAAKKHNIDLSKSYMVGDGVTDIGAGQGAGCRSIFLGNFNSYWHKAMQENETKPDFVAKNILEVLKIVKEVKNK